LKGPLGDSKGLGTQKQFRPELVKGDRGCVRGALGGDVRAATNEGGGDGDADMPGLREETTPIPEH